MKVTILNESGFKQAIEGLSLSYNTPFGKALQASHKLYNKDGGHNKFLESMQVWIKITAPRYFWSEFDTYRIGVTKQSESTIHTIMKNELTQENFQEPIYLDVLTKLNRVIKLYKETPNIDIKNSLFVEIKNNLPEGFLQTRIVSMNYKTLRNIIIQRKNHKLKEWRHFCTVVLSTAQYPEYLKDLMEV